MNFNEAYKEMLKGKTAIFDAHELVIVKGRLYKRSAYSKSWFEVKTIPVESIVSDYWDIEK